MLRACDLLALRVSDVTDHTGTVAEEFTVRQRKTGHGHLATLLAHTRQSLTDWIRASAKPRMTFCSPAPATGTTAMPAAASSTPTS